VFAGPFRSCSTALRASPTATNAPNTAITAAAHATCRCLFTISCQHPSTGRHLSWRSSGVHQTCAAADRSPLLVALRWAPTVGPARLPALYTKPQGIFNHDGIARKLTSLTRISHSG
jgi:hypothetical protein